MLLRCAQAHEALGISFNHPVRIWSSTLTIHYSKTIHLTEKKKLSKNGRRSNDTKLSIVGSKESSFQFVHRMEQCFDHQTFIDVYIDFHSTVQKQGSPT